MANEDGKCFALNSQSYCLSDLLKVASLAHKLLKHWPLNVYSPLGLWVFRVAATNGKMHPSVAFTFTRFSFHDSNLDFSCLSMSQRLNLIF